MDELLNTTLNETQTSQKLTSKEIAELEAQAAGERPICFILARRGSKRLKNKNKLMLHGKPLIQYAIDAAKTSEIFQGVVVSSDDMDILEMAYDSHCLCHQRPKGLAGDKIQMKDVIKYLFECYSVGEVACLMTPCNPFITSDDLKAGLQLFKEKDANYVMSVKKAQPHPMLAMKLVKGTIEPANGLQRTQKYEPMYFADGGFIFFKPSVFLQEFGYGFYGTKNYPYITPHLTVDIDTQENFDLAQKLMENK